jgi:hypothetical protein
MRHFRSSIAVAVLQCMLAAHARAQTLSVSGDPGPLIIATATAGFDPAPVSDNQSSYNLSVSLPGARITGRVDAPLAPGVTLTLTLQAPSGASSAGAVTLDASERDLVTGIPAGSFSGLGITYRLSATTAAGVVAPSTRAVTLTVQQ